MFESTSEDEFGWPSHRISFGIGALLFTLFEAMVARQLPGLVVMMIFGIAVGSLVSAAMTLSEVKQRMQLGLVRQSLAEARATTHRQP